MAENTTTIPSEMFMELLRKAERIAAVERMLSRGDYVAEKDILSVLNVKKGGESDGEV